jgi:hypothetical protein
MIERLNRHIEATSSDYEARRQAILDRQAVIEKQQAVVEKQQAVIENQRVVIESQRATVENQQAAIGNQQAAIGNQQAAIDAQGRFITDQQAAIEALIRQRDDLAARQARLERSRVAWLFRALGAIPGSAAPPPGRRRRIGINVSWMSPGQAGGMEWYVRNLIRELAAIDDRHEWVVVTSPANGHLFDVPRRRWTKIAYSGDENAPLSYAVLLPDPSGRRWTCGSAPSCTPCRWTSPSRWSTRFPICSTSISRSSSRPGSWRCARWGTTTAAGRPPPPSASRSYTVPAEEVQRLVDHVRLKYRLEDPFLYYPANGWRHKNHETLVRAFRIMREKRRDLRLVLTGCEFDVMDRLRPLSEDLDDTRAVRHLGYVDRRDTIGLYAAASAMVFPSLFEGFGLPLLEAMQFGTPIVCSPVASIPEVAGDAAVYAEPGAPSALAETVLRLLEDEELRERLAAAGRERVRRFSFAETARRTLAVFDQVLTGVQRPSALEPFRPLIAHNWLLDGHSRWYFHCHGLREIRLRVAQPTQLPELAEQRMTVWVNEQCMLDVALEPEREYALTIAPPDVETDLHRLDIVASATVRHLDEVLSLQVRELALIDGTGRCLRLIE